MNTTFKSKGLGDLFHAREPIGAALSVGRKDAARGFPTDTDQFFIVSPHEMDGKRGLHPHFDAWNKLPPERRRVFRGAFVHAERSGAYDERYQAQRLPGKAHPQKRPVCVGDGQTAIRWTGGADDDFREMVCPGERCEFRQRVSDNKPPCGPRLRFLFRPLSDDPRFPAPMMKLESGGLAAGGSFKGFFQHVEEQARLLGADNFTYYGLPFVLSLSMKKREGGKDSARRYPVVEISLDGDLQKFLLAQRANQLAIADRPRVAALADREMITVDEYGRDYRDHMPGEHTEGTS